VQFFTNKEKPMKKATKKRIASSASIDKKIGTAVETLQAVYGDVTKAVVTRSAAAKKLTRETRSLSKKRATLVKRKRTATNRVRKTPSAETRKALRTVTAELNAVSKVLPKSREQKAANAQELASLKASLKRASAYLKEIAKADKVLNKPRKKVRRRRTAA
jgi:hypothetical protein